MKVKNNKLLMFVFLLCSAFIVGAQDSESGAVAEGQDNPGADKVEVRDPVVDSLKVVLGSLGQDTTRVKVLNEIAYALRSLDPDGAIRNGTEAKNLAERLNDSWGLALAYKNIGLGYYMQGDLREALKSWEPSLAMFEELGDDQMAANLKGNLGAVYYTLGDNAEALKYYIPSLKMAEELKDTFRIGTMLVNIGAIYGQLPGAQDTARNYYLRAIEIGEAGNDQEMVAVTSMNLGQIYSEMGKYDSAMSFLQKALTIVSSPSRIATALSYMGNIYFLKGDYEQAIETYKDAMEQAEIGDAKSEMVMILLGLGSVSKSQDDPEKAIEYYQKAETIAEEAGLKYLLSSAYEGLATNYAELSDFRNAYTYLSLRNTLDTAFYQSEDAANNLLFNYQIEKKQNEIALLEQEKKIEQLMSRRQKAISIAVGVLGLLILAVAGGIYSRMRFIRKTNRQINAQKELITDSIAYAQRIQSAILPSEALMKEVLPEHFILFKPKDIVSGDFYWIKEVMDHVVIVEADCTGHGVPGAFMSMLGITMFNDLIGDKCYDAPGAILDRLRDKIKNMLVQQGNSDEQKDGMDIALTVYNKRTREIHFAGANNPLYIVRRNHTDDKEMEPYASIDNGDFRLFEIKGDKQPIGRHWEEHPFRTTSLYLKKNDSFYIFSDGYIDQFGGENRKKFKSMNFKKLLLSVQEEPMEVQRQTLEKTFEEWKGPYEQIDDISVLGVRV
jgi:tetratricopeptide (TPR) repeat protein